MGDVAMQNCYLCPNSHETKKGLQSNPFWSKQMFCAD
jgi:hypothetical protein